MTETTVIIDYGSGNIRSAQKALERAAREAGLSCKIDVSSTLDALKAADRLVLPGVGAFADCARGIKAVDGLWDYLDEAVTQKAKPFLGICVGMQLMLRDSSEHGTHAGFGWIEGNITAIVAHEPKDTPRPGVITQPALKIPHMGWNNLTLTDRAHTSPHPALRHCSDGGHAYFVHSYAGLNVEPSQLLATTQYGHTLAAITAKDTAIGTQFHPEKSQKTGLAFLTGFLEWKP